MGDGMISVREAGRRGGLACRERHGPDYYRRMRASQPVKPASYYRALGRLGWMAQCAAETPEDAAERQRRAGEALLARKGVEHFRELGRRSAAARKATREGTG